MPTDMEGEPKEFKPGRLLFIVTIDIS